MKKSQSNSIILKVSKLKTTAKLPVRSSKFATGFDLYSCDTVTMNLDYIEYSTGIAVEIPVGFTGLLFPRSSISEKSLMLKNSVGVIDPDYRGEIKFRFLATKEILHDEKRYKVGEKIGQLVILKVPEIEIKEVYYNELSKTERGEGGFGSTGK